MSPTTLNISGIIMLVIPEISCTLLEMKFYYRLPRCF